MRKAKVKEEMRLVLDGSVSLQTVKGTKVVQSEVLDGEIVLQCVLHVLERALDDENVKATLRAKHGKRR